MNATSAPIVLVPQDHSPLTFTAQPRTPGAVDTQRARLPVDVTQSHDYRNAGARVRRREGCHLPAVVRVNDGAASIWLQRLVTFTGSRFLSGACKTSTQKSRKSSPCVTAEGIHFPAAELPSLKQLLQIMKDDAPSKLTLPQVQKLISMCKFCMADNLIKGFGAFLLPMVEELPSNKVRHTTSCLRGRSLANTYLTYHDNEPACVRCHQCYSAPAACQLPTAISVVATMTAVESCCGDGEHVPACRWPR